MIKTLFYLFITLVLLVAIPFYALYYTSAPLKWLAKRIARSADLEITQVSGDLKNGFSIGSISKETTSFSLFIENVNFKYDDLLQALRERKLTFDDISVARLVLTLKPSSGNQSEPARPNPSSRSSVYSGTGEKFFKEVLVRQIRVANVEITTPQFGQPFILTEFKITNEKFTPEGSGFEELSVTSSILDLQARNVRMDGDRVRWPEPIRASLKPALVKNLRKEIPLTIQGEIRARDFVGRISAIGDKATFTREADHSMQVELKDFNWNDHFVSDSPVTHLSLNTRFSNFLLLAAGQAPVSASFYLGNALFQSPVPVVPPVPKAPGTLVTLVYDRAPNRYQIDVVPDFLSMLAGKLDQPFLALHSGTCTDSRQLLSAVYFNKPYAAATPPEKSRIEIDSAYLKPINAPGAPDACVALFPAPVKSKRALAKPSRPRGVQARHR